MRFEELVREEAGTDEGEASPHSPLPRVRGGGLLFRGCLLGMGRWRLHRGHSLFHAFEVYVACQMLAHESADFQRNIVDRHRAFSAPCEAQRDFGRAGHLEESGAICREGAQAVPIMANDVEDEGGGRAVLPFVRSAEGATAGPEAEIPSSEDGHEAEFYGDVLAFREGETDAASEDGFPIAEGREEDRRLHVLRKGRCGGEAMVADAMQHDGAVAFPGSEDEADADHGEFAEDDAFFEARAEEAPSRRRVCGLPIRGFWRRQRRCTVPDGASQ